MSLPNRNSILKSMGADPVPRNKASRSIKSKTNSIHDSHLNSPQPQTDHAPSANLDNANGNGQEPDDELDQVQKELDLQRRSSTIPSNSTTPNLNLNSPPNLKGNSDSNRYDAQEVIPIQSRSSVVPPDEVLNRQDPVTKPSAESPIPQSTPRSQIQSRNLNLPPLASETEKRKPNGDLILPKSSLGKSGGSKLSKIFGGNPGNDKKNKRKDEIPPDVRIKRYSERPSNKLDSEGSIPNDAAVAEMDGAEQGGRNSKFIWADQPDKIPESQRIRSYRKPGAVLEAERVDENAPQIKEDVIHQERIQLEDRDAVGDEGEQGEQEAEEASKPSAAPPLAAATVAGAGIAGLGAGTVASKVTSSSSDGPVANQETSPAVKDTPPGDVAKVQEPIKAKEPVKTAPVKAAPVKAAPVKAAPVKAAPKPTKRAEKVAALTPEQRHYLLKALVHLQMAEESAELEKLGALTYYGFPFATSRPKNRMKDEVLDDEFSKGGFEEAAEESYADEDQAKRFEKLKEPLIYRQMFHVNLRNFPGLDEASTKYWQSRIQIFFDEMAARNFSTSIERSEMTKRHFFANAIIRYLGNYFSRGFGVRGEGELKGPGPGLPGTERWGVGKAWGKGTVKRGLDKPIRPNGELMEKIDNLFGSGTQEAKVWKLAGDESKRIKKDWNGFKENIVEKETGLEEIQQYLEISTVKNLPPHLKNSVEYARIHAAYLFKTLFHDSGDGPFNVLKGIHSLFPYWGAKQLLQYANAGVLISGILNLLLARPAGSKSLVQRVISFVLGGEMSTIQKEYIKPLKAAINDNELCEKVEAYVKRGKRVEGKQVRARAEKDGDDVLTTILLHSNDPVSSDRHHEIKRMQRMFACSPIKGDVNLAYPSSCPITKEFNKDQIDVLRNWNGNEKPYALKFAQLKLLLRETLKVRDREQAIKVASGSLIVNIIKDSLQLVFYQPIKTIAATADLSDRLGDLQSFLDDLISLKKTPNADKLQDWIALAAKHENSLYYLFHECVSISKPFFDWAQVGCDFMAMGTTDPAHPADRRAKNVEVNLEELLRDGRISTQEVDSILNEVDQLTQYTLFQKVRFELELRKNYLFAKEEGIGKNGLTEADIPSQRMKEEISDLDGLLLKVMNDLGVKPSDGKLKVREGGRGTEEAQFPWAWFDSGDLYGQALRAEEEQIDPSYTPQTISAENPQLIHIRKLLPAFREHLSGILPDWQNGDSSGPARTAVAKPNGSSYAPSVAPSTKTNVTQNDGKSSKSKKSGFGSFFKRS